MKTAGFYSVDHVIRAAKGLDLSTYVLHDWNMELGGMAFSEMVQH